MHLSVQPKEYSGSVYLFSREPCVFQQLIPLLEGAVYRAQISPDEKTIALTTVRGSICLISLKPLIKLSTVSAEHLGERVTCLCWNDASSEVYAGDETGKISVTVISTFMPNGIFQSPSYALMNLDSTIVQIHCTSSLLLVSTLNRCYICDTVLEQYKQIGNKPRDGEFGACFLKAPSSNGKLTVDSKKPEPISNVKPVFSMSKEAHDTDDQDCLPKVYCARPGSRIWEVNANGTVVKTHQFKEALAIPPLPVYKPYIGKLLKLKKQDQTWPVQSINFTQLFIILDKYLFSYTSNGLYVIDPENAEVLLWNDEFPGTVMAQIINDKIYLMTSSGVFHCLTLVSVDCLIIKLYDKKSYKECWELCQILRPLLVNSITEESCDIDIKQNDDLCEMLAPIISLIKSNYNSPLVTMESGMVIVNSGEKDFKNNLIPLSDRKLEERQQLDELEVSFISLNTNGSSHSPSTHKKSKNGVAEANNILKDSTSNQRITEATESKIESDEMSSLQNTISNIQADLESLYILISSQMKPDMSEGHLEELIKQFIEILDDVKKRYEVSSALQNYLFEVIRSAELHYYNTLLENIPIDLIRDAKNQNVLEQLVKIFININASKYLECPCSFPYALFDANKPCEPKFLDIGRELLRKLSAIERDNLCVRICNQIPSMWRDYLPIKGYLKKRLPDILLKQCLQSKDSDVLAMILFPLDQQQWKLVAQVFDSVKNRRCASCGKTYDVDQTCSREFTLDWSAIVNQVIKKQGPNSAMTFLFKVEENLPQVVFDRSMYQSIIFSTLLNHHGVKHAIELDSSHAEHNSICSPEVMRQVVQSVKKDVEETVNKDALGNGPHHWGMRYNLATSTCPCCTLSLQTPVLLGNNGIALFPCGHAYHVNCMIQKKISRCNLHT
ncbi:uncharacterized protein LOC131673105 isoform X2 [Phymastichus coffea]|uniref:uncharacterized protein LOC131673105 isoform X2 n=1 Tax=Phymastichus coffea TaxID=108790 RepID=UPI00273A95DC|nr:uncharacterized protein LOC131673105 isoform X2 [Phymastichus coffea]